ncbi:M50 family metallopeptidase [Streptomyces sp. ISL-22]|uniref:M50 family metallopeptidase n=1 Tax=unclassified Streptomyces TaxID=2593676 RepID=UPI001BE50C82|nr:MULTISPECIES: M50 family metallopeptidase [unclassified Streptomyces]MBT2420579.1 M50 family metallopeptidase [Streptomyces sp. ISL-24]MBT2438268.1 M50 family metallopeptidase [Streptomyces sp. ISL-22]
MSDLRRAAEHEAAHAICAHVLGVRVRAVEVRSNGSGRTYYSREAWGAPRQMAPTTAAGDLWEREFSILPYIDEACSDLRDFERNHGLGALWQAERTARQILTRHRADVLRLADRLEREHFVRFT